MFALNKRWVCGPAPGKRGRVPSDRETSIRRGIEVLLSLGSEEAVRDGGMGVTRISEMLGREKSQVSRALKALAEYGLVERNRDALTYRLGWRIYVLAQLAGESRLLEEAAPRLRRLALATQERAHFSVLQGDEVLTLLSESPGRAVEAVGWVGRVTPAYCTSAGQALLIDHDRAAIELLFEGADFVRRAEHTPTDVAALVERIEAGRARGVVLAADEFESGLVGAAAPVRDAGGTIVGALNVSAPIFRIEGREEELCAAVRSAAADLAEALANGREDVPAAEAV
jgi:DNA-binding IclR family transcriptional regulator